MRSRVISFAGIVGSAMIVLALAALLGLPQTGDDRAAELAETAAALDERATEIAVAATRLAGGVLPSLPGQDGQAPGLQQNERSAPAGFAAAPGSRQAPVPFGETFQTLDGFSIRVLTVDFDAWPAVQAENQFNDPPQEDERMMLVRVEVQNVGGDEQSPEQISESDFRAVGSRGVIYTTYDSRSRCGVIPDELDASFFRGAVVDGNVCLRTPLDEVDLLLIYWPDESGAVYFELSAEH